MALFVLELAIHPAPQLEAQVRLIRQKGRLTLLIAQTQGDGFQVNDIGLAFATRAAAFPFAFAQEWVDKTVFQSRLDQTLAVGGIPLQIAHKYSGILTHSIEGTAQWIKQLIGAPEFARQLGINGREHIRNNFLITRHIKDYMLLFLSLFKEGDVVYL